ncbi:MAG: glycosyltransferase family 4 protein [Myxococcales bacterium]|nr:glycosyltransferase family 4 protein [Myxococcales bacterium]
MIRVLHLRQGSGLYGADRAVIALAEATEAPYEAVVGSIQRPGQPDLLSEEARRRGLAGVRFESARRFDLACARSVGAWARENGVQLLHAHDFKALFVALFAGVPVVATFHGDTGSTLAVRVYELVARLLANFTRGVAAVSRVLEARLRRWVRGAPVAFVPNAVPSWAPVSDAERVAARGRFGVDRFCIAVVGRLSPEKGHRVLFDALRGRRDVVALIAGDGPLREELERTALFDARFLGFVEDTRAVFAAADVVVLPSLTEGLPLVALEAMSLGRCLVASAVGELPELLADGAGVLVPPGDPRALSEAVDRVKNGEGCAAIFGARAAARARLYDVAAMAGAYASLYGRALSPMPSTSR